MPICLATHVSVWFLFVSIILQRSLSLSLLVFFFPSLPAGCFWLVAASSPSSSALNFPFFQAIKSYKELLRHVSICVPTERLRASAL